MDVVKGQTTMHLACRILFSLSLSIAVILNLYPAAEDDLASKAFPHFPSRMHAFIWRNWESVSLDRLAKVLDTSPAKVLAAGSAMGLPPHRQPAGEFEERGYISLIRRNWHLISYDPLLTLLDWNAEQLDRTLRDDDFLWVKVGGMKPECLPLPYTEPDLATQQRCTEIKKNRCKEFW